MSLIWEDEPYVKAFIRDTPEFKAMSYHARSLFFMLMRKVSRAGTLSVGKLGLRGVAVAVEGPWPELEAPLKELLEDGCVAYDAASGVVVIPNFMKAQEASDLPRRPFSSRGPWRIYFLLALTTDGPLVKIGMSAVGVESRVAQIRSTSPIPIEILGSIVAFDHQEERRWHAKFERDRVRGEWFSWSEELALDINVEISKRGSREA